jgi:hypothetical protein
MKRTHIPLFLALALLFLTPGCFQVRQELWHNADGSGKVSIDVGISETFLQLAGGGQPLPHIFQTWQALVEPAGSNYANIVLEDALLDKDHTYSVDMDLKDFSRLGELRRESLDFSVETLENGNLRFSQRLDFRLDASDPNQVETLNALLAGLGTDSYVVRLHVPRLISADDQANLDLKTGLVEWSLPVSSLLTAQQPVEIWAEYRLNRGLPLWFWLLLGALALTLAGLVAWFLTWPRTMPAPLLPPARPQEPAQPD